MNRKTNEAGEVTGVDISGSKIGGPVGDATVIIPDPMGATGGSMVEALRRYRDEIPGTARRLIAVHMIVTPEYLRRVTAEIPEAQIYAIRLDRGLSPADVLQLRPGAAWDKERGLNNKQYIVPGGGGFGELINNAWI